MSCGIMFPSFGPGPRDHSGCRLHDDHEGPHEFASDHGEVYRWETDLECDCESCLSCYEESCVVYWRAAEIGRGLSTAKEG